MPSPEYSAVMKLVPRGSVARLLLAQPKVKPTGKPNATLLVLNCTVPPANAAVAPLVCTSAVKVTVSE